MKHISLLPASLLLHAELQPA